MIPLEPALMALLVICSGLVSGSETALFSLNANSLQDDQRRDRLILKLLGDSRNLLLSILVANNVINIAFFALASSWSSTTDTSGALTIFLGSLTTLILIGEIIPKVLASGNPGGYARTLAPLLKEPEEEGEHRVNNDELKLVIEHSRDHGVVSELIHDRLIEVVDLAETPAKTVMTHRTDLPVITQQATGEEARETLAAKPGPFMLLVDDHEDCIGIIAIQDLLRGGRPAKRSRKPLFIPDSVDLAQVLDILQQNNRNVAVVIDEYGGTAGLISLAHIGNELLGPGLSTELPELTPPVQLDEHHWDIPGQLELDSWQPMLQEVDTSGCTTIGGLIAKQLGTVPQEGDRLLAGNLLFQVSSVKNRRIDRVEVTRLDPATARRMSEQPTRGGF